MHRLLKGRDYGLFQETWLGVNEAGALKQEFPGWLIHYSNLNRKRGGLVTMVRRSVATKYAVTRVALPLAAEGRVLALHFRSLGTPLDDKAHFNLVNIYLSPGQGGMAEKKGAD
jgi:hypothetical protein